MSGLLTAAIRRRLPRLYSTENIDDPTVQARFFTPWSNWTWYAIEFDGEDLFFGLVDGLETELGYFSLSELEAVTGPGGIKIERDRHYNPAKLSTIKAEIDARSFHDSLPFQPNKPSNIPPRDGKIR